MPIFSLDGVQPELPVSNDWWIAPTAVVIGRVCIKPAASVWFGAVLRAEDEIIKVGERSNIQDGAILHVDPGFPLTIGADCTIGHRAVLHGCTIGPGSLVGMCATILNGARIGRQCLIGAGALIPEGAIIPDNSLVIGVPGKVKRAVDEEMAQKIAEAAARYVERSRRYAGGLKMGSDFASI